MLPASSRAKRSAVRSLLVGGVATMAASNISRARQAEREFPPQGNFVTAGGIRLHFLEKGRGRPVVMLHGNGVTADDFRLSGLVDVVAARQYRALAFDRPGFGHSERPFGVWSASRQAALLHRAFVALGIERAIVIGHSWGTIVALALAIYFPNAVGGLILLSGFYRPTLRIDVPPFSVPAIPLVGDAVRYTVAPVLTAAIMPRLIQRAFSPLPVPERFVKGFPASLAIRPSQIRAEAQDTATMNSATAAMQDRYAGIRFPVVIMAGTRDRIVSHRHAEWLHAKIAHSDLRLVPGVGHMIHYAVPEHISAAISLVADARTAATGAVSRAAPRLQPSIDVDGCCR